MKTFSENDLHRCLNWVFVGRDGKLIDSVDTSPKSFEFDGFNVLVDRLVGYIDLISGYQSFLKSDSCEYVLYSLATKVPPFSEDDQSKV